MVIIIVIQNNNRENNKDNYSYDNSQNMKYGVRVLSYSG